MEEVPHGLADRLLVADELTEAGQTLVRALREQVVESDIDGLFKHTLELRVHLRILARDRLKDASDGRHETFSCQARLLVQIESVGALGLFPLLVNADERLTKLAAKVECVRCDLILKDVNDLL